MAFTDTWDAAFELIEEYDNMLSFYSEESQLWKFNNSVIKSFPMDEGLLQIYHLIKGMKSIILK